ncbi:MAG: hypothetical protein J5680_01985 [Neisseriaceae bacterium]|nr:hypothetical protein [Neisseriaceae bacterium]
MICIFCFLIFISGCLKNYCTAVGWATCCPRGFITLSGCLKSFRPLWWARMPTLQRHLRCRRWGEAPPYEAVTLYSAPVLAFVQLRL